tara:strand:+ start:14842 stop:15279 length:438 start_codon:yes stop_codon:yes gene_type:complete
MQPSCIEEAEYATTNEFVPRPTRGKVVKVYDGDTVWCAVDIDGKICRVNVRMLGYDCAEMRSKDPVEKSCAYAARDELRELVLDRVVNLTVHEADKYGRLLCTMTLDQEDDKDPVDVNAFMLSKWGVPYAGGHKEVVDWSTYPKK